MWQVLYGLGSCPGNIRTVWFHYSLGRIGIRAGPTCGGLHLGCHQPDLDLGTLLLEDYSTACSVLDRCAESASG